MLTIFHKILKNLLVLFACYIYLKIRSRKNSKQFVQNGMLQSIFTKISLPIACYLDFDYLLVMLFHTKIYGIPIYLNIWEPHIVPSRLYLKILQVLV